MTRESDTMGLTLLLFKEILPLPVGYLCIHEELQGPGTLLENQEAQSFVSRFTHSFNKYRLSLHQVLGAGFDVRKLA